MWFLAPNQRIEMECIMLIGKPGPLKSGICTADETSITVRGQDLCNEQIGVLTSTEFSSCT